MKKTEIIFLLDRSGSMGGLENDIIGGYNSFIESQKKKGVKANLTTVLFDNYYEVIHDQIDINMVKHLTNREYYVRGTTALLDAIGITIKNMSNKVKNNKAIFVITTDGLENASREYNREMINKMIKEKNKWEIIYLGANIDAYQEGMSIGIKKRNISNYKADKECTKKMYKVLSDAIYDLCCNHKLSEKWNSDLEK